MPYIDDVSIFYMSSMNIEAVVELQDYIGNMPDGYEHRQFKQILVRFFATKGYAVHPEKLELITRSTIMKNPASTVKMMFEGVVLPN